MRLSTIAKLNCSLCKCEWEVVCWFGSCCFFFLAKMMTVNKALVVVDTIIRQTTTIGYIYMMSNRMISWINVWIFVLIWHMFHWFLCCRFRSNVDFLYFCTFTCVSEHFSFIPWLLWVWCVCVWVCLCVCRFAPNLFHEIRIKVAPFLFHSFDSTCLCCFANGFAHYFSFTVFPVDYLIKICIICSLSSPSSLLSCLCVCTVFFLFFRSDIQSTCTKNKQNCFWFLMTFSHTEC